MAFDNLVASVTLTGSLLSFVASTCVLISFAVYWREQRSFRHALILNLTLAEFINSLDNSVSGIIYMKNKVLMPGIPCAVNGLIGQISVQAVDFSILAIAIITLLTVTRTTFMPGAARSTKIAVCLSVWILPIITGTVATALGQMVPVGTNWCWISAARPDLRYGLTHGWRIAVIFGTIAIYLYIWWYLRNHFNSMNKALKTGWSQLSTDQSKDSRADSLGSDLSSRDGGSFSSKAGEAGRFEWAQEKQAEAGVLKPAMKRQTQSDLQRLTVPQTAATRNSKTGFGMSYFNDNGNNKNNNDDEVDLLTPVDGVEDEERASAKLQPPIVPTAKSRKSVVSWNLPAINPGTPLASAPGTPARTQGIPPVPPIPVIPAAFDSPPTSPRTPLPPPLPSSPPSIPLPSPPQRPTRASHPVMPTTANGRTRVQKHSRSTSEASGSMESKPHTHSRSNSAVSVKSRARSVSASSTSSRTTRGSSVTSTYSLFPNPARGQPPRRSLPMEGFGLGSPMHSQPATPRHVPGAQPRQSLPQQYQHHNHQQAPPMPELMVHGGMKQDHGRTSLEEDEWPRAAAYGGGGGSYGASGDMVTNASEFPMRREARQMDREIKRMLLLNAYPILYVILWIPGLVNRLMEAAGKPLGGQAAQALQSSSQYIGLANALTYGFNRHIRHRIKGDLLSRWRGR